MHVFISCFTGNPVSNHENIAGILSEELQLRDHDACIFPTT